MPRHLINKQKKYIDELIKQGLTSIEQMNLWQYGYIEEMNDFETLYQAVDRYIWDRRIAGACDAALKKRSLY